MLDLVPPVHSCFNFFFAVIANTGEVATSCEPDSSGRQVCTVIYSSMMVVLKSVRWNESVNLDFMIS